MGRKLSKRNLHNCFSLQWRKSFKKTHSILVLILFCFSTLFSETFTSISTGRDSSGLYYLTLDGNLNYKNLNTFASVKIFEPLKIESTKEDYNAYCEGESISLNRMSSTFLLSYGREFEIGGGIYIEYNSIKELQTEWYNINPCFILNITTPYGKFCFHYEEKNNISIGYKNSICYSKIKLGFESSFQLDENYLLKNTLILATFKEDLMVYITYNHGFIFSTAYPFEIGISKRYSYLEIKLDFMPSDLVDNCFNLKFFYYFD